MRMVFTILALLAFFIAAAQVPEPKMQSLKIYGGDGYDEVESKIIGSGDGGFIVYIGSNSHAATGNIGSLCPNDGNRSIFLKYNSDASVLEWSKCFVQGGDTGFLYIFPKSDGGFVLGGEFKSGYGWGFYICRQDAGGNILWSHSYGRHKSPLLRDMMETQDGGYIMYGVSHYTDTDITVHYGAALVADMWVLRLDSMGNKVWSKVIGGTDEESAWQVIPAPGDGCYVVGGTLSNDFDCTGNHSGSAGVSDAYIARLDANGNILWHKDMGGSCSDGASCAWPDGKGGLIFGGGTCSDDGDVTHKINPGAYNIWVFDIDSNGNKVWGNCYGGGGNESPYSICKATDGSIWLANVTNNKGGEIAYAYGRTDAWFVHADSAGNFINAKVMGSSLDDQAYMIYPLSNNNVIGGGFYEDSSGSFPKILYGGGEDAFLVIFEPQTTFSETVERTSNEVSIYPNPARDNLIVSSKGIYDILITDMLGRNIYDGKFIDKLELSVSAWSKGMYYVQVHNEQYGTVQKVLIN